jgi:BirA family biotin operon repressor/biotin-[acetyl-CoA-carboxylase] ligase
VGDSFLEIETIDSTNSFALREICHQSDFRGVYTWNQLAGRGRAERKWESLKDKTLSFSFTVSPSGNILADGWIPLLTGFFLVEIFRAQGLVEATLKWPNDVLVGGKKISGILVEKNSADCVVVGVGINVFSVPPEVHNRMATCLSAEGWLSPKAEDEIIRPLFQAVEAFVSEVRSDPNSFVAKPWQEMVARSMDTLGRKIVLPESNVTDQSGIAEGLGLDGSLLVRFPNEKKLVAIYSGDVFHIDHD